MEGVGGHIGWGGVYMPRWMQTSTTRWLHICLSSFNNRRLRSPFFAKTYLGHTQLSSRKLDTDFADSESTYFVAELVTHYDLVQKTNEFLMCPGDSIVTRFGEIS